ncbi:hypothetical protein ACNUKZ_07755 [Clostridium perfringens]|uniref:hypothetical protein n=1 Tax=Clostridium perfringens TaxID=1502 RepID=UPI001A3046E9|nr:hypothetical protein [Clostridium perfringens]CAJ1887724.1 hypothetical protein AUSP0008_00005 [uncultured phage]HAT4130513.1 hypothetical protein [Clostridium perfringens]
MKKLHEENIKNLKKRKEIDKTYKKVSDYYLERLEAGTLDFSKERLLLESERTYYDSPAVNNLVTIFITMMVTPFTPEIIEVLKNIFKDGFNEVSVIAGIVVVGFWAMIIIPGFISIIRIFANMHKSFKDRNLYYTICLEVLEELEG